MDFCAVVAAIWLAYWIHATWRGPVETQYSKNAVLAFAAGFAVVMVLLLEKHGDYRRCLSLLAVRETERLLRVTMAGVSLALPMLLVATGTVPRTMFGLAAVIVPLILALEKWQMQKAIRMMRRHASFTRKAVILGTGTLGRRIFSTLVCSPKVGIDPVAFAEAGAAIEEPEIYESSYQRNRKARVLPGPVTPRLLRRTTRDWSWSFWRRNCSAMNAGPSPARSRRNQGYWKWPTAARCFSTRLGTSI